MPTLQNGQTHSNNSALRVKLLTPETMKLLGSTNRKIKTVLVLVH